MHRSVCNIRVIKVYGKLRSKRYFTAGDYNTGNNLSDQTRANYDNSVRYNDSIVASLIEMTLPHDAIVIYVSDHAQDVFQSGLNGGRYSGHAVMGNELSESYGKAIPMVVAMSDKFRELHPDVASRIEHRTRVKDPWNTIDFTYLVMDILGLSFADRPDDVKKYSPLAPD